MGWTAPSVYSFYTCVTLSKFSRYSPSPLRPRRRETHSFTLTFTEFLFPIYLHTSIAPPMASTQVGVLIPLNKKSLKEDKSLPELPVYNGDNVIGRNNVPVADKRLSRKHITLSTSSSANSSADLFVEGMNPVVIDTGSQRKMVNSREKATIRVGDVVELIPGSYCFKYLALIDGKYTDAVSEGRKDDRQHENVEIGKKREREELTSRTSVDHSMVLDKSDKKVKEATSMMKKNVHAKSEQIPESSNTEEAIRSFHISDDKIPLTFRLMKVRGLPKWANTSCVSVDDVVEGDVLLAILSNYMVDMDWLLSACPMLRNVPQVMVVHGESDGRQDYMKRSKPNQWILHKPSLPISYGTHHSKAMFLVYPRGLRVIVHTANLIDVDWNNKSQGLWMQDFPWKDQHEGSKGSQFESDLISYLQALKLPEFFANLPTLGRVKVDANFFKKFDYGDAAVRLIASVPGYHSGPNLKKWGHMKLRSVLEQCTFDAEFKRSPLIYQFSSLGSLDEKWMTELRSSMSSGLAADKTLLGSGDPLIIWPTVEDVRWSLEGYAAGSCIPSPVKNVEKEFLRKYLSKWKATHTGRCCAMPHIKTFARYKGQNLAWFLLTSSNLSKAAWGALQKNSSQLMIRSYELGVLFLPGVVRKCQGFSCTDNKSSLKDQKGSTDSSGARKTKLVSLAWQCRQTDDSDHEIVQLPVPYELPPQLYSSQDVPWSWDRQYREKDVYGKVWPR